jgi:hypothetical protein
VDSMPTPAAVRPQRPAPAPEPLVKRLLMPLGSLAVVGAAFGYVGLVNPNHPGHYPVCPLLALTGIYCPGCGGLRSAYAVAHGHFGAALSDNALAVIGYGVFAVVMAGWLIRAVQGRPTQLALRPAYWWAIGAVILVFTVVRNLPMGSALAP